MTVNISKNFVTLLLQALLILAACQKKQVSRVLKTQKMLMIEQFHSHKILFLYQQGDLQ